MSEVNLKYYLTIFIIINGIKSENIPNLDHSTLKQVHVSVRNGKHSPDPWMMQKHPNYERKDQEKFGGYSPGELTEDGKKMMFDVGKNLRSHYGNFLGRTTLTDYLTMFNGLNGTAKRSLESALLIKEGLRESEWKYVVKRQWSDLERNRVHSKDFESEAMYYIKQCPRFKVLQNRELNTKLRPLLQENYKELLKALKTKSKWKPQDLSNLFHIYELYSAEKNAGEENPNWLTQDLLEDFRKVMDPYTQYSFSTSSLKKMGAGLAVKGFLDELELFISGQYDICNLRLFLYVGNGGTLAPQFAAFGGENGFVYKEGGKTLAIFYPEHGSAIIMEVHQAKETAEYYLKFFYKKNLKTEMRELIKPDCDYPCKVSDYKNLLKNIAADEEELKKLCNYKKTATTAKPNVVSPK